MTTNPPDPPATPVRAGTNGVEELAAERRPRVAAPEEAARRRVRLAWMVAMAADFLQIVAFPLFWWGAVSPFDDVLDLAVAAIMIRLVGWHWAFLPTVLVELVPGVDMIPCWTAAVFIATRAGRP